MPSAAHGDMFDTCCLFGSERLQFKYCMVDVKYYAEFRFNYRI
jgi:hypothetical protein